MFATDNDGRKVILTKAREVTITTKVEDKPGRQTMLHRMHQEPELVDQIYIDGHNVDVIFNHEAPHTVGVIANQYTSHLNNHETKVRSWKITGGYPLDAHEDPKTQRLANYGINLEIVLL